MKLIAYPGNDLTILHDSHLFFYDRGKKKLMLKAVIEIKPNLTLLKASLDTLLLKEEDGKQNRILLVDLNEQAIVNSVVLPPFTLCDHFDNHALVIFSEKGKLQLIDITQNERGGIAIPADEKVSCLTTCQCKGFEGQYLLGLGLYNGTVQIWRIQVDKWKYEKLLEKSLHEEERPIKDISFIDECRIVSGGLDKTIKLLTFNQEGQLVGDSKEFKMTLQCRGMRVDGVIRDQERNKLLKLIDKAVQ